MSYADCTEVSAVCPVEATVLGYYPNLGSNIFFTIGFGVALILAVSFSVWKRTWSFGAFLGAGLLLEMLGYVGRALMNSNPWDEGAFTLQICTIIIGPTFICAALYLTLKHVALALSPALSRIRPRLYPFVFLPADLTCLIIQAIGGGVASAADNTNQAMLDAGNNLIIAGIVLQVVVLIAFGIMGSDYLFRVSKLMRSPEAEPAALAVWGDRKFRMFMYAFIGAYFCVLIRCIYRIAEMSGGWGNDIMQDEPSFLVLDSSLMLVATWLMTAFHPGLFFPQMANGKVKKTSATSTSTEDESAEKAVPQSEEPLGSSAPESENAGEKTVSHPAAVSA